MNNVKRCVRCREELEIIIEGFAVCKNCKRLHADHGGGDYDALVYPQKRGRGWQPVFWINDQLSLVGPIVFACFTSINNEQHYMAGPSMKALRELTDLISATPRERATLTAVDEAEVSKLNLKFFNQAKKEVLTYQRTYYLGTH